MNEKYTGNSLWHKTCTTTFPYKTVVNNGNEEKYYVENTHEAIITQEQFDKVQQLILSRTFEVKKCHCPLNQKIYCDECGTMFRIKHINGNTYWECRNYNTSAKHCNIKQISEKRFYKAFIHQTYIPVHSQVRQAFLPFLPSAFYRTPTYRIHHPPLDSFHICFHRFTVYLV